MRGFGSTVLRTAVIVLGLATLAACSRVEFVYDRADWFVARWAANYLDLERVQRNQLRDEIATYRTFHREVRVPQIRALLRDVIDDLEAGRHDRAHILSHFEAAQLLAEDLGDDLLPLVSDVLADLKPEQQARLLEQFEERREEMEKSWGDDKEENSLEARQKRMRERAEDLLGKLSEEQKDLLNEYVAALPDTGKEQLGWETDRQNRLLTLLEQGASSGDVEEYLRGWWFEFRDQPAGLREAREQRRELTLYYLTRLLPTLDSAQTAKLVKRLESHASDLERLLE